MLAAVLLLSTFIRYIMKLNVGCHWVETRVVISIKSAINIVLFLAGYRVIVYSDVTLANIIIIIMHLVKTNCIAVNLTKQCQTSCC